MPKKHTYRAVFKFEPETIAYSEPKRLTSQEVNAWVDALLASDHGLHMKSVQRLCKAWKTV